MHPNAIAQEPGTMTIQFGAKGKTVHAVYLVATFDYRAGAEAFLEDAGAVAQYHTYLDPDGHQRWHVSILARLSADLTTWPGARLTYWRALAVAMRQGLTVGLSPDSTLAFDTLADAECAAQL